MSLFSIFCRHKWQVLSNETTKTQIDILKEKEQDIPLPRNDLQLDKMTKHFYIQILTCEKCGKIKRFKTSSD